MCGASEETVQHIISACTCLAPTSYLDRHNNVAKILHQEICKVANLIRGDTPYYKYNPAPVRENENWKICWDIPVQTDHTVLHNRPDIILQNKNTREISLIDVTIPLDDNIDRAYKEKIRKYEELAYELRMIWGAKRVKIEPVVISANGLIHKELKRQLAELNVSNRYLSQMQKAVVLGTAGIVRRFLSKP